jgi:hypothetical protein
MSIHARKAFPARIAIRATAALVAGTIAATVFSAPAMADERKPARDAALPGVDRSVGTSAVTPLPEPDEALPAGSQPGSYRVGGWDITISGSISYEIGFGDRSNRRDRR